MYIFFLGGADERTECNTVYRYDTLHDVWKEMTPMVCYHSSPTSLAIRYDNRRFFVFGPIHCEKYDIYTNAWSLIQPPPYKRMRFTTGHTMNNKVYMFGKRRFWEVDDNCFIFDPLTNTWQEQLDPLPWFSVTKSFLGKTFSLFHKVPDPSSIFSRFSKSDVFTFSELNLENCNDKKKFVHLCHSRLTWYEIPAYMIMLSRGARLHMEQNETLENVTNIGQ
jgi:hypothetical protein